MRVVIVFSARTDENGEEDTKRERRTWNGSKNRNGAQSIPHAQAGARTSPHRRGVTGPATVPRPRFAQRAVVGGCTHTVHTVSKIVGPDRDFLMGARSDITSVRSDRIRPTFFSPRESKTIVLPLFTVVRKRKTILKTLRNRLARKSMDKKIKKKNRNAR